MRGFNDFWVSVVGCATATLWGWMLLIMPIGPCRANERPAEASVAELAALVKDGNPSAYLAAETLGHIGQGAKDALPILASACSAKDARLRVAAAVAILEIDPSEVDDVPSVAVKTLLSMLKDKSPDIRREAVRGLGHVRTMAPETIQQLALSLSDDDAFVATHAADTLAELGEPAVASLIEGVKQDSTVMLALVALGRMGEKAKQAQAVISKRLGDLDPIVRQEAALTLGQIKPEPASAVASLLPLLDDPANAVKGAAVVAITLQGAEGKRAAGKLTMMLDDKAEFTRLVGAYGLAMLGVVEPAIESKVLAILTTGLADPRPLVRRESLRGLASLGAAARSAREAVEKLLADPEEGISSAAKETLEKIDAKTKQ
ncbi:HEAT repeat domain-containing protein [bacterium]|nr:HEAT repeat domain-containing protein [bacterium]